MKAFDFPLQTALDVRQRKQDAAHREFAALQRDHRAAESQLHSYHRVLARAEVTARHAAVDDVDVIALLNYDGYRRRMAELIEDQSELCQGLRVELSQARRRLMEACRSRQTLILLRESNHGEYLRQVAAIEGRALDETGTIAHVFNHDKPLVQQISGGPLEAS
jgi:flagellar export protein FliJ